MNRFLKYFLAATLILAFPKASIAATALTCTSDADAGNILCTCDMGTSVIEASSDDTFTTDSCNAACDTLHGTSYLLESCVGVDESGEPILSTIDQNDVTPSTSAPVTTDTAFIVPVLNVQIPGFSGFTQPTKIGDTTNVNFLAEYINAIFSWALAAGALVAVVMMMLGGLQYVMSRGKSTYIEKAKTRITNAITGLVLLLAAYEIAFIIDPNTTVLRSLNVRTVNFVELVQDSGDAPGSGATPDATTVSEGILCDESESLYSIATSTLGRVTYRFGGKFGQTPPYAFETRKDPSGRAYSSFCPEGQLCLDCSGYEDFLRKCAGLPDGGESGGTAGIFKTNSVAITSFTDSTYNNTAFTPGDLIGFPTVGEKIGHVVLYIGNGKIAEAHGGSSGRKEGGAAKISSASEFIQSLKDDGRTVYVRHR